MRTLTNRPDEARKPGRNRNIFTAMAIAGSLALAPMAAAGCNNDCALPGSCETKDYPAELREGERIETLSGQYPLRLEVLDITQQVQPDAIGRCEVKSDRASVRLSVYPPGTTELDSAAPVHTRDFYIYPGSCIGIWDYCLRIEGTEMPADIEKTVTVDGGLVTTTCTPSNERVKFTISLSRGEVSTPDGGYFQGDSGTGGSSGDSSGGTGGS